MGGFYDVTYDEEGYCGVTLEDIEAIFPLSNSSEEAHCDETDYDGASMLPSARLRGTLKMMHSVASTVASTNTGLRNMRRVIWGYFLGAYKALDIENLVKEVNIKRRQYWDLVEKHRIDNIRTMQTLNPQLFHPLAPVERNPWELNQRSRDLLDEIWQDVERTYQERSLFTNESVRKTLQRVLYVWSKEHSYISYKQGMNELLAVIYIVCYRDQLRVEGASAFPHFSTLCSEDDNDLEADAYTLLDALMSLEMQLMYDASISKMPLMKRRSSLNVEHVVSQSGRTKNDQHNSFIARTKYIYSGILKEYDTPLFNHLQNIEIEPHVFLMRWIRLIFSREFNVNETLNLWDTVFADHFIATIDGRDLPQFEFEMIDFFAVAMLSFVRLNLMENDINYCLQRLFKFPPIENISHLISKAHKIRDAFYKRHMETSNTSHISSGCANTSTSSELNRCRTATTALNKVSRENAEEGRMGNHNMANISESNDDASAKERGSVTSGVHYQRSGDTKPKVRNIKSELDAVASRVSAMYEKALAMNCEDLINDIQVVHSKLMHIILSLDS